MEIARELLSSTLPIWRFAKTSESSGIEFLPGSQLVEKQRWVGFYGFKLHLVINHQGELLGVQLTPGNCDDRQPVPHLTKGLCGKIFGDKGYISKKLFQQLFDRGLQLITTLRRNMKPKLLSLWDKLMLRKRSLIETVNDQLKNISQIEHTRHRSPTGFVVNLLAGLIAYTHQPKKPAIRWLNDKNQLLKYSA